MKRRGYTLVEFLVVLAVVGILAALLIPVFMRAEEGAKGPSCPSNLKQIGLGLMQYTQDYDERFPPVGSRKPRRNGWAVTLQLYVKSTQILLCPQYETPSKYTSKRGFTDYWLNARLAGRSAVWLSEPASVFLGGEGNDGTFATDASYSIPAWPREWSIDGSPVLRHGGAANFLFADGHVKMLIPSHIAQSHGFEPRFKKPRPRRRNK